jgi:hypothetical protein
MYRPSGVMYVLWTALLTGMLLTRASARVSTTSTAPGISRIDTYTRLPSRLAAMLFG